MATSSSANGRANRSGASKRIVVLKLSSDLLSRFSTPAPDNKENNQDKIKIKIQKTDTSPGTPVKEQEPSSPASSSIEPPLPPSSVDNASDGASTPAPGTSAADTPRRKGIPGPKPGSKRGLNQAIEVPKPRGKPGPKKKPRIDDGVPDPIKLIASHKLGPKANTGAINAGLRALDRSGAPCRKWERKALQLKSFTGVFWQLPSWRAPKPPKTEENGEAKEAALETGDSDSKANQSASGAPSEKSNLEGDLTPMPPNMTEASSPAPAIAMTA